MSMFSINPTASKRKLTKQVMNAIEDELKKCSPHYELTLDIKIIENKDRPIPEIISKRKWRQIKKENELITK